MLLYLRYLSVPLTVGAPNGGQGGIQLASPLNAPKVLLPTVVTSGAPPPPRIIVPAQSVTLLSSNGGTPVAPKPDPGRKLTAGHLRKSS